LSLFWFPLPSSDRLKDVFDEEFHFFPASINVRDVVLMEFWSTSLVQPPTTFSIEWEEDY
jgi:hypothetical protein